MASSNQETMHKAVSNSCCGFASTFQKEISTSVSDNIVSSPFSVHMILSLLSHGATRSTLQAFTDALHHVDKKIMTDDFQSLMIKLNDVQNVKLHIANALYVQEGVELEAEFLTIGRDVFKSTVSTVNFENSLAAAQTINDWVKKSTENLIPDVVSADDFNALTKLVLVNAIYFKGRWLHQFDVKHTYNRIFHVSPTQEKNVPTMYKKARYSHGEMPGLRAEFIEIPYLNTDIAMIIILPNELDGLQSVESNFNWDMLLNAPRNHEEVELRLPKFKFEAKTDLKDILCKLGMSVIFQDAAEFSNLSKLPLKVSKVLHKAVIEVSEEGTEAAAATVVQMRLRRMITDSPKQFTIDRPFMFIIEYRPSKLPLFVGSVRDIDVPAEKDEL